METKPTLRAICPFVKAVGGGLVRPCWLNAGHKDVHRFRWFDPPRQPIQGEQIVPATRGDSR